MDDVLGFGKERSVANARSRLAGDSGRMPIMGSVNMGLPQALRPGSGLYNQIKWTKLLGIHHYSKERAARPKYLKHGSLHIYIAHMSENSGL